MKNSIAQQWESFSANVLPRDAPTVQRQEMRRAFYAGAHAMLEMTSAICDPSVSEDAGVHMIHGWFEESAHFAQQVVAGSA